MQRKKTFYERLKSGLEEVIAHREGKVKLHTRVVEVPERKKTAKTKIKKTEKSGGLLQRLKKSLTQKTKKSPAKSRAIPRYAKSNNSRVVTKKV